jgi:hypothetical protein
MGDFGAASFYSRQAPHALSLQRLEVRAFGCLLEELIDRCDPAEPSLTELQNRCLSEKIDERPLFGEIVAVLAALTQT